MLPPPVLDVAGECACLTVLYELFPRIVPHDRCGCGAANECRDPEHAAGSSARTIDSEAKI